jgi:hypothetical protein
MIWTKSAVSLAELNTELERLQMFRQKTIDDLAREKNLAAVDLECARHFPPIWIQDDATDRIAGPGDRL